MGGPGRKAQRCGTPPRIESKSPPPGNAHCLSDHWRCPVGTPSGLPPTNIRNLPSPSRLRECRDSVSINGGKGFPEGETPVLPSAPERECLKAA